MPDKPPSDYRCPSVHVEITLMPPHVLEKIMWPYICELIYNGLRFTAARVTLGPVTGCCRHFGQMFDQLDLARLLVGSDPLRDICEMIAKHWVRKILIEVGNRRMSAISITLDDRWIPTMPRTFWRWLRNKPAKRLRSQALELCCHPTPHLVSRVSYVIHGRD
jgi:hypothetical protein